MTMGPYDDQDDLDRWLASQQAPTLDGPPPAAAPAQAQEQPGAWARAAQMLGAQSRNSAPDPAPRQGAGETWGTILGMLASKDPASVLANDAANRHAAVDAWQRRQAARDDSAFGRQAQAAGLLMHEDAAKRAAEAQQFEQDRATGNDIEQAANIDWQHGHTEARDSATDQHWTAEEQRARDQMAQQDRQFGVSQSGMNQRNAEDNSAAMERARLMAGAQAGRDARADAAAQRAEAKAALQEQKQNATLGREFSKDTDYWRQIAQQVDDLDAITGKYKPGTLPGIGIAEGSDTLQSWRAIKGSYFSDPKNPNDARDMRYAEDARAVVAAKNRMGELLQRKESGAAGPLSEKDRYMIAAGARPNATEAEFHTGLKTLRRLAGMEISTYASGREDAARGALEAGGLGKWLPPSAAPAPAEPAAAPLAGDRLPTTTTPKDWRNAPKVDDYLRKLSEDDQDIGVTYGR